MAKLDDLARQWNYDLNGARKAGVPDDEIEAHLLKKRSQSPSGNPLNAIGRGVNAGAANLLGFVPDAIGTTLQALAKDSQRPIGDPAWGLRLQSERPPAINTEGLQNPIGGSQWWKRMMNKIPTGGAPLAYENLESLPKQERPFAFAGEQMGGALAALPLTSAVPLAKAAFKANPRAYMGTELSSALGSSFYGGLSYAAAPESPGAHAAGSILGGMHPIALLSRASSSGANAFKNLTSTFTKEGTQARAGDAIRKALESRGESKDQVLGALRKDTLVPMTSGQLSESPTLLGMEAQLGRSSKEFDAEMARRTEDSLKSLRSMTMEGVGSGDPEAFRKAAQTRANRIEDMMKERVDIAARQASKRASSLGGPDAALPRVSREASETIESAILDARTMEKEVWGTVDMTPRIPSSNVREVHAGLREQLLPENTIKLADAVVARYLKPPETKKGLFGLSVSPAEATSPVPASELFKLRSDMLDFARQARANADFGSARIFNNLANAALDDLKLLPGNEADLARKYSKAMHDKFSRTFVGDYLATKASGAKRVHPELTLESAFGTGGTKAGIAFRDLQEAADFVPNYRDLPEGVKFVPNKNLGMQMTSAQERFLRTMSKDVLEPSGRVNPEKYKRFMDENAYVLERFPELREKLSSAAKAEEGLRGALSTTDKARAAIDKRAAFSQILGSEDPAASLASALRSKNPGSSYRQYVTLARRGGPEALGGLKNISFDVAAKEASTSGGGMDFVRLEESLIKKRGNSPGLLPTMELNGVVTKEESLRLKRILGEGKKIQAGMSSRADLDEIQDAPSAFADLVTRWVGARASAPIGGNIGSSLVIAGAGAKFAKSVFDKMPRDKIKDVIQLALKEPKFMAVLLEKTKDPKKWDIFQNQIEGWLISSGIHQFHELRDEE